jgi:hypothetical protein
MRVRFPSSALLDPAQVVEVQAGQADLLADLAPDRLVEVGTAQLAALRPDEDESALPWFGEPFEMPPDLRSDP